jgi:hypothetical protein
LFVCQDIAECVARQLASGFIWRRSTGPRFSGAKRLLCMPGSRRALKLLLYLIQMLVVVLGVRPVVVFFVLRRIFTVSALSR